MPGSLVLAPYNDPFSARIQLPNSKSIANRVMILDALFGNLRRSKFYGDADDVKKLWQILSNYPHQSELHAGSGGTTFRFALSFLAVICKKPVVLIADSQLSRRPIEPLIESLQNLGLKVATKKVQGDIHIDIKPLPGPISVKEVYIKSALSSQFASSLALIAPWFTKGLSILFKEEIASKSYLKLTDHILRKSGIDSSLISERWHIKALANKNYKALSTIEKDWSAAVFFLCMLCLRQNSFLILPGLRKTALQGDASILNWLHPLGLSWTETDEGMSFSYSSENIKPLKSESINLYSTPDHAPALVVTLALLRHRATITGLRNLKFKESNRQEALYELLKKMRVTFYCGKDFLELQSFPENWPKKVTFNPRKDHRMAMAASLLSSAMQVEITNPGCVSKSFPEFWNEFAKIGSPLIH
ncbi:MAG TPA: hypothetical protein VJ917_05190 [Saprospiraceae bacterium]|nr:hypothetical protein [Saprospiraceae bacterium]